MLSSAWPGKEGEETIAFYPKVHYKNTVFTKKKKMFVLISVGLIWASDPQVFWRVRYLPVEILVST